MKRRNLIIGKTICLCLILTLSICVGCCGKPSTKYSIYLPSRERWFRVDDYKNIGNGSIEFRYYNQVYRTNDFSIIVNHE